MFHEEKGTWNEFREGRAVRRGFTDLKLKNETTTLLEAPTELGFLEETATMQRIPSVA